MPPYLPFAITLGTGPAGWKDGIRPRLRALMAGAKFSATGTGVASPGVPIWHRGLQRQHAFDRLFGTELRPKLGSSATWVAIVPLYPTPVSFAFTGRWVR